jgi:anti-anti-sigma factor
MARKPQMGPVQFGLNDSAWSRLGPSRRRRSEDVVIDVTVVGPRGVVFLAGAFDVANSEEICSVATELVAEDVVDLTVDVSGVTSMAPAGFNALLAACKLIEAGGGQTRLVGGEIAEFLVDPYRVDAPRYLRTGRSTGRTHVLDVSTGETLCGAKNRSGHADSHPDFASCLPCWAAWELQVSH